MKNSPPVFSGLLLVLIFSRAVPATARSYDMYRADFEKGAFCSAIGGACASDDDLENGFFQNPAALAVHEHYWNFDGDYAASSNLEPGMKVTQEAKEARFMFGAGFSRENWGYGFSITSRKDQSGSALPVHDRNGNPGTTSLAMKNSLSLFNLAAGHKLTSRLFAGVGLTAMFFDQDLGLSSPAAINSGRRGAFPALAVTIGVIDAGSKSFRAGSWLRTSLVFHNKVRLASGSFSQPVDYRENMAVRLPWMLASGISYMPWADARTIFFDVNVIGNTPAGYQLTDDAFAGVLSDRRLRSKGRTVSLEPRLGYRTPWSAKSRVTLLTGGYYETGRWDGLPGRLHFTGGAALRTFTWLELMGGFDVAKNFFQLFLTFR